MAAFGKREIRRPFMCAGHNNHYKNVTSAINEYLWPEKKARYSTKDISRLKGRILACSEARDAERVLLEALSTVTGMRWETRP